jgi:hypothetical protein
LSNTPERNIKMRLRLGLGASLALTLLALVQPALAAPDFSFIPFRRVWMYHDFVVAESLAQRAWTWGPGPISELLREPYAEGEGGTRQVQYFDKGRMEINDPNAPITTPWYVTTGRLPVELITGHIQTGDQRFDQRAPAALAAVGDPGSFPSYADLLPYYAPRGPGASEPGTQTGSPITRLIGRDEDGGLLTNFVDDPATQVATVSNGYPVPRAFVTFMNQRGLVADDAMVFEGQVYDPLYIFGLPMTQPFWVYTQVGGVERPVLIQVFERRILTYNPANPEGWQVEMANVGQQYHQWRYGATAQPS